MPVNDLGYRGWDGETTSPATRWMTIASSGIKIVLRSSWVKRILFVAWGPVLFVGVFFFIYEYFVENRDLINPAEMSRNASFGFIRGALMLVAPSFEQAKFVVESFSKEPDEARGYVWSFILMGMFRRTQGFVVLMLVGLIVPPLISRDIRSRAFLFYFSKPVTRLDYLLGKFGTIAFFLALVTLVPALGLYCFGVLLSPTFSVVLTTWLIPIRIALACAVLIIPACLIGLAFSSLSQESRFAGFAWFTIWILGLISYRIVYSLDQFGPQFAGGSFDSYWKMVSLYDTISYLQSWIMGLESNHTYALQLLIYVALICVFCSRLIMQKISAPMRA